MKEEEFDQFIRERIDSLNVISDVQWDEEKVWEKIKSGKGFSPNFKLFMYGIVLIITTTLITLSSLPEVPVTLEQGKAKFEPAKLKDAHQAVSKALPVKEKLLIIQSQDVAEIKKMVPQVKKEIVQDSVDQKISEPEDKVALKPDFAEKKIDSVKTGGSGYINPYELKNSQEIVFSTAPNNLSIGLNKITYVSPRFSLVYGLYLKKFSSSSGALKNNSELSTNSSVEIPLQVRYQFLPGESKFSVFLYSELHNSLLIDPGSGIQNYSLNYRLGTELRYRFYEGNDGSAAHFFFRLPVYEKNLINKGNPNSSSFDLIRR